jgi:site-specific DNA-methyltransferase (adenine-specific)
MSRYTLHVGDCRDVMLDYPANHFDSIVSDPPYGLSFMGKGWDKGVPGEEFWREALRVAKPGAHLLAFGGTRTFHRLTVAIEDAGWEIRDVVCWLYGSGFPKSHDVSKAIDRAAGAERDVLDERPAYGIGSTGATFSGHAEGATAKTTAPATPEASAWQGWGTALKPAWEPILMARKPLEGTVAANLLKHGTGAINVDGCRIGAEVRHNPSCLNGGSTAAPVLTAGRETAGRETAGRWPANFMHDGSPEVLAGFPLTGAASDRPRHNTASMGYGGSEVPFETRGHADGGGSAARFFYCAKTSSADREEGCEELAEVRRTDGRETEHHVPNLRTTSARNHHPTVKPTELMRHLVRLVTPPGGLVLDPFMGSGSTGKAAILEGARFVGCDLDPAYLEIAEARIAYALRLEAEEAAAAYEATRQLSLFGDP